jgi:hypothetical protein
LEAGHETRTLTSCRDEVVWDYAPSGTNQADGRPVDEVEKKRMEPGPTVIGRKARKPTYREYTAPERAGPDRRGREHGVLDVSLARQRGS